MLCYITVYYDNIIIIIIIDIIINIYMYIYTYIHIHIHYTYIYIYICPQEGVLRPVHVTRRGGRQVLRRRSLLRCSSTTLGFRV